jgi:uncharacterized membrane protein YccC
LPAAGSANPARLAADVIDLGVLTTQIRYDRSRQSVSTQAAMALHARLLMLLPLLSSVASRLSALRRTGSLSPALSAVLADAADFVANDDEPQAYEQLAASITKLQAAASKSIAWSEFLQAGTLLRLRELVTLFRDCRMLQIHLRAGRSGLPALAGGMEIEAAPLQHRDVRMALFSGLSAGLAVALVCAYWIAAAWQDGAVAAEMAAIACCLFAAQDDPAPAIMRFLCWSSVAIVVDGIYLFALLPAVDGFVMLAVVLAPTFILYGLLSTRPATAPIAMPLATVGATVLALQETYSGDFASFVNGGIATVIGLGAGAIFTKLIRSVGADWSAWRLVRSNWLSLAKTAKRHGHRDRAAFAGLMMDRIGLVTMQLSRMMPQHAPSANKLQADLRVGLNIVDLGRARHNFPPAVVQALDATLDGIAKHYRTPVHFPP